MAKRSVIATGNGFQDQEFVYPFYRLLEAGYEVEVAVPNKKDDIRGITGVKANPTKDISELKISDYELLCLPGGVKAIEKIRQDKQLIKFISDFYRSGKVILSICHGAQLLISAGLVKGRRISGYYSVKEDIINAGGTYVDEPAVIDERICSTAHYKDMGPWMKAGLELAEKNQHGGRL